MIKILCIYLFYMCASPYSSSVITKNFSLFDAKLENLTPYTINHGSRLSHRAIRECQAKRYGVAPHEIYPSQQAWNMTLPFVEVKRFLKEVASLGRNSKIVRGHVAIVSNPLKTVSVLEPGHHGGCNSNMRQTVVKTAEQRKCLVAVNAGYFDTHSGKCLGNVIADGFVAHNSGGVQNAHFGVKKDGSIFTGYVSDEDFHRESETFLQLVGGVVWLVRNGSNYVNTSKYLECENTEETGSMDTFVSVLSARTAVGHDSSGGVIIVHVEGKSSVDGVSLFEFQDILRSFDVLSAINLDGGGSSTFVVNGTVVNYPYDDCIEHGFACDRNVSTVLCVHPPECEPINCSGHGQCHNGICVCDPYWLSPTCGQLFCHKTNCSGHGDCSERGCICEDRYFGDNCDKRHKTSVNNTQQSWQEKYEKEYKKWNITITVLSIVTAVCVASCLLLLFYSCSCICKSRKNFCTRKKKYQNLNALVSDIIVSDSSDSEGMPMKRIQKK